jgi:Skp family chaperone for outer membrane proteins
MSRRTTPATLATVALSAAALLTGAGFFAGAQANANAATRTVAPASAIATVDLIQILDGLREKSVLETRLEQSLSSRQAQLDVLVKQIDAAKGDLETLSKDSPAYREKFREVIELSATAEARKNVLQRIIAVEKGEMLGELYAKIEAAVAKIAQQGGYDIVLLDDSTFPIPTDAADRDVERAILTRSLVYRGSSTDITQQVVTLMNNEFGG